MSAADPVEAFREVAAAHPRCFWLDGGGAREWSGRRSLVGWLEPDDVSLTYSAATRRGTRHVGGASEVVGDDIFAVLEAELAAGSPRRPVVRLLRLRLPGPTSRPRPSADVPDAVWMRPSHVRLFDHDACAAGTHASGR